MHSSRNSNAMLTVSPLCVVQAGKKSYKSRAFISRDTWPRGISAYATAPCINGVARHSVGRKAVWSKQHHPGEAEGVAQKRAELLDVGLRVVARGVGSALRNIPIFLTKSHREEPREDDKQRSTSRTEDAPTRNPWRSGRDVM